MSTRRARAPRDHVTSGTWPYATLDSDPAAAVAQHIAAQLRDALDTRGWSLTTLHRCARINRQTVTNVLEGRSWATIAVLADLEHTLGTTLWPTDSPIAHQAPSPEEAESARPEHDGR